MNKSYFKYKKIQVGNFNIYIWESKHILIKYEDMFTEISIKNKETGGGRRYSLKTIPNKYKKLIDPILIEKKLMKGFR